MEKKMGTPIVYWGYIEILEKKMETIIVRSGELIYWGHIHSKTAGCCLHYAGRVLGGFCVWEAAPSS